MVMRLPAIAVACSGLVFAGTILHLNRDDGASQIVVTHMPLDMMEIQTDEEVEVIAPPPSHQPSRSVAPDIIAVPEIEPHLLERIEPRAPLAEVQQTPETPVEPENQPAATQPAQQTILHKPVALAAGVIEAQGHKIALAEIIPTEVDEQCTDNGKSWSCGTYARTAFRNWLRGRALTCTVPAQPSQETVISECMLGNFNPAEWLVEYGWARAQADSELIALEDIAREERRGMFGPAPSQELPLSTLVVPGTETMPDSNAPVLVD